MHATTTMSAMEPKLRSGHRLPGRDLDLVCNDGEPCTDDLCDAKNGCFTAPTDCSDGDACNGDEICVTGAGCSPGTPPDCDDGSTCTEDTCIPATGCNNAWIYCPPEIHDVEPNASEPDVPEKSGPGGSWFQRPNPLHDGLCGEDWRSGQHPNDRSLSPCRLLHRLVCMT